MATEASAKRAAQVQYELNRLYGDGDAERGLVLYIKAKLRAEMELDAEINEHSSRLQLCSHSSRNAPVPPAPHHTALQPQRAKRRGADTTQYEF